MGADCGLYINDVPTVFVSLENPYHLLDFPRVRTYINCYSGNAQTVDALMGEIAGAQRVQGKKPGRSVLRKMGCTFINVTSLVRT